MAGGMLKKVSTRKSTKKIKKAVPVMIVPTRRARISGTYNTPLPQSQKATHRYATSFNLDPSTGGVLAKHVFSANGMYDPDITGSGHQPNGFDQLATLYNHYTVVGSKITIQCFNYDSAQTQIAGLSTLADSTGFTGDIFQYVEQGKSKYVTMGQKGADRSKKLVTTFSTKKFFRKSNVMDEDDLKGDDTQNPTEQAYYHVVAAPIGAVDTAPVQVFVVIEYSAVWHEPKTLAQS